MKTFSIQTLGCRVNHYESQQIAELLRRRGLVQTEPARAELRVINTCSVTTHAASQSRQSVRRLVRLPVLPTLPCASSHPVPRGHRGQSEGALGTGGRSGLHRHTEAGERLVLGSDPSMGAMAPDAGFRPRVLVTGCWATSDRAAASAMPGVDAVLGHHEDVASELDRLLTLWRREDQKRNASELPVLEGQPSAHSATFDRHESSSPGPMQDEKGIGWIMQAGAPAGQLNARIKTSRPLQVNGNFVESTAHQADLSGAIGTTALPLLGAHQTDRQRALLKIQDGCDARCTYCIIPTLRPRLWSKPVEDAVAEASALVDAGHCEIVLTGIFLGAYGQSTALRRRQPHSAAKPLGELIEALCTKVPGLRRLRLSSLEPGDLTDELLAVLRAHEQVVPHFHLPLQSGSDLILRRMNRQYTREDYLRMIDRVRTTFDRPALTTDIVVGFPGEDDAEFEQTAELAQSAGFVHIHAFPYSPRPGTAAARWTDQFIHGPVLNERIDRLREIASHQSFAFRSSFVGETVEVIVERDGTDEGESGHLDAEEGESRALRHGRCERYFSVWFEDGDARPGDVVRVRVDRVTPHRTSGERFC